MLRETHNEVTQQAGDLQ